MALSSFSGVRPARSWPLRATKYLKFMFLSSLAVATLSQTFAGSKVVNPRWLPSNAVAGRQTDADTETAAALETTYEVWSEQFPIAAARGDFYGLSCDPPSVQNRMRFVAEGVGISVSEALQIFRKDLWVLCEPSEKIPEKLAALRGHCSSEEELLDFLRAAPRSIGTTTAVEIKERGIENMKLRSYAGEAYEMLISPARFLFQQMAKNTAARIRSEQAVADAECEGSQDECATDALQKFDKKATSERETVGAIFFGSALLLLGWLGYMDSTYGGPIHGKGLCPASPIPTYNLPDAEGNTRLPCTCAPIYKWYLEPLLPPNQYAGLAPKVESKNCGRQMGGQKRECDPTTVGGCVWTAEDLEKHPSTWDRRELLYWEKQQKIS
mmetsp:Transcript_96373/g.171288  ORF Transcript_96373/g.171288 Transcript_96373/m.171288 type:complete len:383 (+) Transcript_96373:31-1179(+)